MRACGLSFRVGRVLSMRRDRDRGAGQTQAAIRGLRGARWQCPRSGPIKKPAGCGREIIVRSQRVCQTHRGLHSACAYSSDPLHPAGSAELQRKKFYVGGHQPHDITGPNANGRRNEGREAEVNIMAGLRTLQRYRVHPINRCPFRLLMHRLLRAFVPSR